MPLEGGECPFCDRTDSHLHTQQLGIAGAMIEAQVCGKRIKELEDILREIVETDEIAYKALVDAGMRNFTDRSLIDRATDILNKGRD